MGEEINIASGKEISIGDLAEELIRQINPEARILCEDQRLRPEKSEVTRLLGSNEKLTRLTQWKQKYPLSVGLQNTIQWIKENGDRFRTDQYIV